MPSINLTLPLAGNVVTAGLHATNYAALQALLNGGLDEVNLDTTGTPSASTFLRGDMAWASAGAMVQLSDTLLVSTATSFDITGISQDYNHLKVVLQARGDNATTSVEALIRFNNDSGANYDRQFLDAIAAAVGGSQSEAGTAGRIAIIPANSAPASHAGQIEGLIANYDATTFHKTSNWSGGARLDTSSDTSLFQSFVQWRSTAAINRITITPSAGNFVAGSRLTIYGVL